MSKSALKESPFIQIAVNEPIIDNSHIRIVERPFLSQYLLRGCLSDSGFTNVISTILCVDLPVKANTITLSNGITALWMSPDQWLLITENEMKHTQIFMLQGAIENVYASVNDISSGQTIISLSGTKALDVLAKGTSFDVHPSVFKPGQCAQTLFAKMNVLIYPRESEGEIQYDMIVRRSFSDFMGKWLIKACYEYG